MDKKLLFVFNPHAGKAKIKPKLADIIDEFVKSGYWVTAYTTQSTADAKRIVREHAGEYDIVVCSGGDGTLNEVVNGMVESKADIPIGYIPAGSTNDYGRSLGIPRNMLKAAKVITQGKDFQSDLGILNDKSFVYVAAFGAFTKVSYETSQQVKNVLGHSAYLLEGVKSIADIQAYPMRIEVEDEVLEDSFIFGMITNTLSVGGFKNLTGKEVILDDGLFEMTFISKPSNPLELQSILAGLMIESISSKCIHKFKASHVRLQAEQEVPWTIDGEYGGDHREVEIENLMQAFKIRIDENHMNLSADLVLLEDDDDEDEE